MNTALINSFNSFKSFLNLQGKFLIFTALFYALLFTQTLVIGQDFILQNFNGRMIGIATLNGFDVSARVALFYKAVGFLFGIVFILIAIAYFISKKNSLLFTCIEVRIINYISLAALLIFIMKIMGYNTAGTMDMAYFVHKSMALAFIIRIFLYKKNRVTLYNYTFIILFSLCLNFLLLDLFAGLKLDFFMSALFLSGLLTVLFNLILKNNGGIKQSVIDELIYSLFPLAFLPLVHVLKDEFFLISKARHLHFGSPLVFEFILLLIMSGWIIFRRKAYIKKEWVSQKKMLALKYFPALIFSLIAYAQYRYIVTVDGETFELGLRVLPVMEFKLFDVIPTLEKFNSHLISDYFFPAIYTVLNGGIGYDMLLYDFLYLAISYVLYYYLVYYISGNAYLSLFTVIFFPFCIAMLPDQFSFGVFAFLALQKVFSEKPTLKKYILFFASLAGIIAWRVDLGYTCILVTVVLFIYYHLASKNFRIKPLVIAKATALIGASVVLIIGCFCLYRNMNLFKNISSILDFLKSAEVNGYSNLGRGETPAYKLHYFIFPPVVASIIIALILNFKSLNKSRSQRYSYLALLFISVYYIANFNRGLIRHSLIENTDYYTSSYVYIIITGALFVFLRNQKQTFRYAAFFIIATLLLLNYKVPLIQPTTQSFFENAIKQVEEAKTPVNLSRLTSRVSYSDKYKTQTDSAAIKFINTNTTAEETFIDFSNTPMLYFSTKKITPSLFVQNPICSQNDKLQDRFIDDLKNYKTPFVLYSTTDNSPFDAVDGVPNSLRHYRIAEYLFQNYKPYLIAGRFHIWKANSFKSNIKTDVIYHYVKSTNTPAPYTPVLALRTELKFKPGKKYMAKFVMANPVNMSVKTRFGADTASIAPEYITENLAVAFIDPKAENGVIELQNIYDQVLDYQVTECDYTPDLSFEKPTLTDFSLLPYIWGTHDKKVSQEPVLFDASPAVSLQKGVPLLVKFPETIDKTSGNTILMSFMNNSGAAQKISLTFGNTKDKTRTKIDFIVIPSAKEELYAVRISSSYKWYSPNVNELQFTSEAQNVAVSKIYITKGM